MHWARNREKLGLSPRSWQAVVKSSSASDPCIIGFKSGLQIKVAIRVTHQFRGSSYDTKRK